MKLVFKLPEGKPPFIGIHFDTEYEGSVHEDWMIEEYHQCLFKVTFLFHKSNVEIKLINERHHMLTYYKPLEYDQTEAIRDWLFFTGNNGFKHINFGHITGNAGQHVLIKTSKKKVNMLLKVETYEIQKMDGLTERLKELVTGRRRFQAY